MQCPDKQEIIKRLEFLYDRYNHRKFAITDPVVCIYGFGDPLDREIAAFIASSLAYGRVAQIQKSTSFVFSRMGNSLSGYVRDTSFARLEADFSGFAHRFANNRHLAALLYGVKGVIEEFGSLGACVAAGDSEDDTSIYSSMKFFCSRIRDHAAPHDPGHLLAMPEKGSACKRLCLLYRWMVRKDEIDCGIWDGIDCSKLLIPLDVHMFRLSRRLGFTRRKSPSMVAAIEITRGFAELNPSDPVKYDFALSRIGITGDKDADHFLFGGKMLVMSKESEN